jgi:hypothetical protein
MSQPRKTIKIADLVALVNRHNRESTCQSDVRHGWNALLEDVLHGADAYAGFGYLSAAEVPPGHQPGIVGEPDHFSFPDESRRRYYLKSVR